jgi:hypothetical protein
LNAGLERVGRSLEWPVREPENCSRKQLSEDDGVAELSLSPRFVSREKSFKAYSMSAYSMSTDLSKNKARFERGARSPVAYAVAVAVFGLLSMLIVDHGPWNRPHVQTAEAHYATTSAAARAAGAKVTPTMPKPGLEPVVPGPKPVQSANPATP